MADTNNPLRDLRFAITPTQEQLARRHWRDKGKQYLLQRELADLIPCSVSCVRECERHGRFPLQDSIRMLAMRLHEQKIGANTNKVKAANQ